MGYFGYLKVYALTWMEENYMGLFGFSLYAITLVCHFNQFYTSRILIALIYILYLYIRSICILFVRVKVVISGVLSMECERS